MFGRKKRSSEARDAAVAAEATPEVPQADGPHDRSEISDVPGYYTDLGFGHIDLGAMVIGVPKGRDLNVAMDPNGQPEFHVVSTVSRVIPRVFAAPKSAGQWRTMVADMREQLEKQGGDVSVVDGPWGRELVAEMPGAVFRAIGVDGHRWTAEVRIMAVPDNAEQAAEEGRDVFKHLLVNRGTAPMPVREQLALTIPEEIQTAITKAQSQLAAQQQAQAYQQQMAAGQQQGVTGVPPQTVQSRPGQVPGGGQGPAAQTPPQGTQAPQQSPQASTQAPQAAPQASQAAPQAAQAPDRSPAPRRDGSAMDRLRDDDI